VIRHRDGTTAFRRPDGVVIEAVPALSVPCASELTGLAEDPPVWDGARCDVAYAIDVLYQRAT
jgi:hypothetical protein